MMVRKNINNNKFDWLRQCFSSDEGILSDDAILRTFQLIDPK